MGCGRAGGWREDAELKLQAASCNLAPGFSHLIEIATTECLATMLFSNPSCSNVVNLNDVAVLNV